ncbi:uncharacterized protein LOC135835681 isoform X2 [Planococcus citri]|uniref:uncharacterized protein LOC135835681 isoform X2 n=1 Tax=Planococcus citri TaxID=170843 RepID=UPI0031F75671
MAYLMCLFVKLISIWYIVVNLAHVRVTNAYKLPISNETDFGNSLDLAENIIDTHTDDINDIVTTPETCSDADCKFKERNVTTTTPHAPLFGFIPRECPQDPLPELFPVRKCTSDQECWPRVCCFDDNELTGFCRIAIPVWDQLPMPRIVSPLRTAMAYWQCTPPPPPSYDLFPKPCRSTFDCFPNLCCQEKDKKVCRPPKKSILTLISNFAQRESWFG